MDPQLITLPDWLLFLSLGVERETNRSSGVSTPSGPRVLRLLQGVARAGEGELDLRLCLRASVYLPFLTAMSVCRRRRRWWWWSLVAFRLFLCGVTATATAEEVEEVKAVVATVVVVESKTREWSVTGSREWEGCEGWKRELERHLPPPPPTPAFSPSKQLPSVTCGKERDTGRGAQRLGR